jgi:nitroreductase
LLTRQSAKTFGARQVSASDLETALSAAVRAPDHGRLRPWRFMLVQGSNLERLGEIFATALRGRGGEVTDGDLARERDKTKRAPLIIVVVCRVVTGTKVPEIEQVIAAGAAAENLLLAFHALGYGAVWKTGAPAYDPSVKRALALADSDHIIGFIYAGGEQTYTPGKAAQVTDAMLPFPA